MMRIHIIRVFNEQLRDVHFQTIYLQDIYVVLGLLSDREFTNLIEELRETQGPADSNALLNTVTSLLETGHSKENEALRGFAQEWIDSRQDDYFYDWTSAVYRDDDGNEYDKDSNIYNANVNVIKLPFL